MDTVANQAAQQSVASPHSTASTDVSLDHERTSGGRSRKSKQLSLVNVQSTNIPPKEVVTYAKLTQTIDSGPGVESRGRYVSRSVTVCVYKEIGYHIVAPVTYTLWDEGQKLKVFVPRI